MSPRNVFEQELKELRSCVAAMGKEAEAGYLKLFEALENRDQEALRRMLKNDRERIRLERNIESRCLSLILRQQPVAGDLRMVSASLKAVTDMERVGDHVTDIAELLLRLSGKPLAGYSTHFPPMILAAGDMVHAAVEAFTEQKPDAAEEVIRGDDVVDELFNKVKMDLIRELKQEKGNADECVDALMIAKYLEKIGDHAVNIAQWEVFRRTGEIGEDRVM